MGRRARAGPYAEIRLLAASLLGHITLPIFFQSSMAKIQTSDVNITPTGEKAVSWLKDSQEGTLTFRMGILRFRKDRTEAIIETCQKGDAVQRNSEIFCSPSICPEPDGLAVVIC